MNIYVPAKVVYIQQALPFVEAKIHQRYYGILIPVKRGKGVAKKRSIDHTS
jgi:hypothetical protein